ncbi:MAG: hypothetical protein IJX53_06570 [Clostridia bacterium]|nr:hypothetical protein [Clostridia bacterium]
MTKTKRISWGIVCVISCLLIILLVMSMFSCAAQSSMFYHDGSTVNGVEFYVNQVGRRAFVGMYTWDGSDAGKTIVIPDKVDGMRVDELGGATGIGVPTPFIIQFPESYNIDGYYSGSPDNYHLEEAYTIEEIVFSLHLGKYVEFCESMFIEFTSHPCTTLEDGSKIFYRTSVYVTCDEENKTFYAKEGRLYRREDDSLVDAFYYAN